MFDKNHFGNLKLEFICSPAGESAYWHDYLVFEIWNLFFMSLRFKKINLGIKKPERQKYFRFGGNIYLIKYYQSITLIHDGFG